MAINQSHSAFQLLTQVSITDLEARGASVGRTADAGEVSLAAQ